MNIFCTNCKHSNDTNTACEHQSNILTIIGYDDYYYSFKVSPSELNKNNNCNNFEPSLWYTIKRFIFKNSKD